MRVEGLVLRSAEQERAFKEDWLVHGLTLREMAAMHDLEDAEAVRRVARRLALPPRRGRTAALALEHGRWERRGLVQVWVPHDEDLAS